MNLTGEAIRVLGALVEKERTTPEYYPLSLNALINACNQKTNRDPVMGLGEADVAAALEILRTAGLVVRSMDGGRVARYGHNLIGKLGLAGGEIALLGELLLRGPQTVGELRARAERMHHFADPSEVEAALEHLAEQDPVLVEKLPRQPGHKEPRFRHCLGSRSESASVPVTENAPPGLPSDDRVGRLEVEVRELRAEVAMLWKELRSLTLMPE